MTKHKYTHTGKLLGDARASNTQRRVFLRETKMFWVTPQGMRFRKRSGTLIGHGAWPMWDLDLNSIKPIDHDQRKTG